VDAHVDEWAHGGVDYSFSFCSPACAENCLRCGVRERKNRVGMVGARVLTELDAFLFGRKSHDAVGLGQTTEIHLNSKPAQVESDLFPA
jgi:hypothetical protein